MSSSYEQDSHVRVRTLQRLRQETSQAMATIRDWEGLDLSTDEEFAYGDLFIKLEEVGSYFDKALDVTGVGE